MIRALNSDEDTKTRFQFQSEDRWRVLSLGQFFFVKIWPANNDLLSVAELQLLWEDKVGHHDDHNDDDDKSDDDVDDDEDLAGQ